MPHNLDRRLVSISHACELVGVSRRTVYNWIQSGKLETVRIASGSIRIYADSLFRPSSAPRSVSVGGARGRTPLVAGKEQEQHG